MDPNYTNNLLIVKRLMLIWFSLTLIINVSTIILNPRAGLFAIILLLLLIIPIAFYFYLNHIGVLTAIITNTDNAKLIHFQIFRLVGGFFILAFFLGQLSGYFAIPAGLGDIITGLLAYFFGKVLTTNNKNFKNLAIVWNIFGMLDLTVAIIMGIITNPGPFQISSFTGPQFTPIYLTPLLIIPTFIVPFAIILHIMSLQKLNRQALTKI